ncbi:sodium/proton-translocating pyrophosphatase [Candidatus Cryosericum septentrionale]|uniref:Sodium/proton-translocating pyrophosphatase n=1 Tax=Candidatus Cryosericum septentrionale TaxID=2290913 RepID=A0A398DXE1_9BACT|nr:sodium/proton-translocating pyrophosphatase [Candidatus Cryosericum septentrionale]
MPSQAAVAYPLILVPILSIVGLLFVAVLARSIARHPLDNEAILQITLTVHHGATTFLAREYAVSFPILAVVGVLLALGDGLVAGLFFVVGAGFSVLAGYVGMQIATMANGRTTLEARRSLGAALNMAFPGGSVMGIVVSSLGVAGSFLSMFGTLSILHSPEKALVPATGYSMGASLVALFARVGGGIYTKTADVGADLVGKVEAGIPEDDPRNPASIVDNVGDVAGMGADLYESYVGAILAADILGYWFAHQHGIADALLPVRYVYYIVAAGLMFSLMAVLLVKLLSRSDRFSPESLLRYGSIGASVALVAASLPLCLVVFADMKAGSAVTVGVVSGVLIGLTSEYFTSSRPVAQIALASKSGAATNILSGMPAGMRSVVIPVVVISAALLAAYAGLGMYGIALAGVGMLGTPGISLSVDAYGRIADNAGGIAELTGQLPVVRERTDQLDSLGNTTAAMGKGFPVGSTAMLMVAEVHRQFREIPGLLQGLAASDPNACIAISTRGTLKYMVPPALVGIAAPFVTYFLLGKEAVGGLLLGATVTGTLLGLYMANAGGAWDNAKKLIERSFGGKASLEHRASVVGDTVGDPLKDTAGPSLNILIKLISVVSLSFLPLFMK